MICNECWKLKEHCSCHEDTTEDEQTVIQNAFDDWADFGTVGEGAAYDGAEAGWFAGIEWYKSRRNQRNKP